MSTSTETLQKSKTKIKIPVPKRYRVIFLNDNVTTMAFVVQVLMEFFRHEKAAAIELTMKIDQEGRAIAGVYNFEIAEQKAQETIQAARLNDFPLQVTLEAE